MNTKVLLVVGGALIGTAVSSCGGGDGYGDNGNVNISNGGPQTLTVQQVLSIAQQPSETAEPFAVDNGQTTIVPADDETSDPETI